MLPKRRWSSSDITRQSRAGEPFQISPLPITLPGVSRPPAPGGRLEPEDVNNTDLLELRVYAQAAVTARGLVFLPGDSSTHEVTVTKSGDSFKLTGNPLNANVSLDIVTAGLH